MDVELKVRTRAGPEESFSRIANLSAGGLFVTEVLPYDPGTVVDVTFILPDDGTLVHATAEVIHARDVVASLNPDRLPGHGLRFVTLESDSREALRIHLGEDLTVDEDE